MSSVDHDSENCVSKKQTSEDILLVSDIVIIDDDSENCVSKSDISDVVTGLNEMNHDGLVEVVLMIVQKPSLPITPENYQSEEERIKSFVEWPLNEAVHPEQLARVGFVYTGDGALVQCFQCGVKYRHWYKGDVPLSVHQNVILVVHSFKL